MRKDFKKFILRGNVIDLAIAVVIGASFNGVISSLVKDLITPLVAAIGGKPNFTSLYFTIHHSRFYYGDFINSLVSFIILATVIFFLVIQPINKLISLSKKDQLPQEATKSCPECLSVIPLKATRCAFCTAKLKS
jgi:large conductance mechanosensitive channel